MFRRHLLGTKPSSSSLLALFHQHQQYRFASSSSTGEEPFIPDFSHAGSSSSSSNKARSVGKITKWVEDKGFGFVNLQGKSLFVHARELVMKDKGKTTPQKENPKLVVGQTVEFTVGAQPDGRLKAVKISQVGGIPLGQEVAVVPEKQQQEPTKIIKQEENDEIDPEFDFDLGEGNEVSSSSSSSIAQENMKKSASTSATTTTTTSSEPKSSFKKKHIINNNNNSNNTRNKLFSAYQWNCVESGNPNVDGFKVTQFPTNPSGNTDIPVPDEKWNDNNNNHKASSSILNHTTTNKPSSASSTSATTELQDQRTKTASPPPPSSNSRPIWESELLGWPTEFSAREMDFFDLEELEERRSGWIANSK